MKGENAWEGVSDEYARVRFITACPRATIWSVFIPTPSFEVCAMVARQQASETTSPV